MSSLNVTAQVNNHSATATVSTTGVNPRVKELQTQIQTIKDQKSECLGRIHGLEATLNEAYEQIGSIKETIRVTGFEIGNARADLSVTREKYYTLRQAKMEKEAKAQFGDLVENGQKLVDSLYQKRDLLKEELQGVYDSLPLIKQEIADAYDELTDLKFDLNRTYMEYNKIKPKVSYAQTSNEVDEAPKKRRCYGKPPGGSRKSHTGH